MKKLIVEIIIDSFILDALTAKDIENTLNNCSGLKHPVFTITELNTKETSHERTIEP